MGHNTVFLQSWLAHCVVLAHEDGSYWVFQKWLHALKQEPSQILEASAELLSQCFLDYTESCLFRPVQSFTVVMLYSYRFLSNILTDIVLVIIIFSLLQFSYSVGYGCIHCQSHGIVWSGV